MGAETIELFHEWGSIQSLKCRIGLAELDLPWISRRVDLAAFDNLQADYLSINPLGLVPALRCDDVVLVESSRINEWLNEIGNGALLPAGERGRESVRRWTAMEDNVVHPAVRPPTFNLILKARVQKLPPGHLETVMARHPVTARADAYRAAATAPIDRAAIIASIVTMRSVLLEMENALQDSEWLANDTYSLADVAMTAFIDRLDRLAMDTLLDAFPNTRLWAETVRTRPSFRIAQGPFGDRPDPLVDRRLVAELIAAAL
ncbi:glutathione S-transferase family protein [Rhizobium sp. PL01]|uniref:glutathione S-transferase family protein n=1 Tax=Rhizobium sp. PL01 TaxID=3085631 RepID=UPI002981D58C|nr:glutathione S-transferase family protein [Rhizobium sp. PL01]MDW5316934.1 glutathione S-transferase family protein [Rhizobium sp. PL01]